MSDEASDATGNGTGSTPAGEAASSVENGANEPRPRRSTYTESEVIMSTVRVVTPFVLTFGLYVTFHGADSPGGGFQGGALVGTVILMLAFAFGIDPTRRWLGDRAVTLVAALGLLVFAGIGFGSVALDGAFLEYARYPLDHPTKLGIEAVEIGGIALIVGGVITGLFFLTAAGPGGEET